MLTRVKEVVLPAGAERSEAVAFAACVATILECSLNEVPAPRAEQDGLPGWLLSRWLGGLGLGLAPVADASSFSWAGPWIARLQSASNGECRPVVMYGVPSGVVWDPAGITEESEWRIKEGFLLAAGDIALARPPRPDPAVRTGTVRALWIAAAAGKPARQLPLVTALAGRGLEGDRHVAGTGTFPSGLPGSALTLIETEVCESFCPPLAAGEHRRNIVTRGIDLNALVGCEFTIGPVRCRGMRLCEPCTVIDGYATRPILRSLIHRGGLRADIMSDGDIAVGDPIRSLPDS
jgi:hypothetical protein